MCLKAYLLIAGLAAAPAAFAQMPDSQLPQSQLPQSQLPPSQLPQNKPGTAPAADVTVGTVVRGSDGAVIGKVTQIGVTATGEKAVVVDVDGKRLGLSVANLALLEGELKSPLTKAEVLARANAQTTASPQ